MFHVGKPLYDENGVCPSDVAGDMITIRRQQMVQVLAYSKFLGQMENRPQKFGKCLVFEQVGIFEQPREEISVSPLKRS